MNSTPNVGAIAHWEGSEIGSIGHVAYVEAVNPDGSVNVSEYNYSNHVYSTRCNIRPPRFIHVRLPSSSPIDYIAYLNEASATYAIPFVLLKAIAIVESGIDQSASNPDGGSGVMQLTGTTKTLAAQLLGVGESQLSENTAAGARLNILGGAAVLRNYACWACPRVFVAQDFNNCSQNIFPYALRTGEKDTLKNSIEVWWWPLARYNGGGADGSITTTNYTFRLWDKIKQLLVNNVSYPPLARIAYRNNGELSPTGTAISFSSSEISSGDDLLFPTPQDLGKTPSNGIRWVNGNFNPFVEVTLHTNNGSALPVEISSFTASVAQSRIFLRWRTETEVNDYGFEIERRAINKLSDDWIMVGAIMGSGTTNSPREYSFTDYSLSTGRFTYRIKQIDKDGSFRYYGTAEVEILAPSTFALEQNYPNPFNPSTVIRYALASRSFVRLKVFNIVGQQLSELVNGEEDVGYHEVTWQGNVPSGFYVYRIDAIAVDNPQNRFIGTRKALFVK